MDARDLSPPANWSPLRAQDLRDVRMWKRERVRLAQGRHVLPRAAHVRRHPRRGRAAPRHRDHLRGHLRTLGSGGSAARERGALRPGRARDQRRPLGLEPAHRPCLFLPALEEHAGPRRHGGGHGHRRVVRAHPPRRPRPRAAQDRGPPAGAEPPLRGRAPDAAQGRHLSLGAQPRVRQPQLPRPPVPHGGGADGRHRPPRLRPPHRPPEPRALRRAPGRRAGPSPHAQGPLRRALRGPRSLQGGQRHVRARGRRPAPRGGARRLEAVGAARGHGVAASRATSSRSCSSASRTWRTRPASPTACIARWPRPSSSASTRRCPPPASGSPSA
jgi:hypothetical protein